MAIALVFYATFSTKLGYIAADSFIGGGNRSPRRNHRPSASNCQTFSHAAKQPELVSNPRSSGERRSVRAQRPEVLTDEPRRPLRYMQSCYSIIYIVQTLDQTARMCRLTQIYTVSIRHASEGAGSFGIIMYQIKMSTSKCVRGKPIQRRLLSVSRFKEDRFLRRRLAMLFIKYRILTPDHKFITTIMI